MIRSTLRIFSALVFHLVLLTSAIPAHAAEDQKKPAAKPTLEQSLLEAERQMLSDPLAGRHMIFAYAAVTAPAGYANILMNVARDPAVRQVISEETPKMQKSVRDTWINLMSTAEPLNLGSNPSIDWMTQAFYGILQKGFFPPAATEKSQLFMQMGEPNAYTFTLGPNAPMVNVFDGLIDKMPQDAVISVLGHELGHNQGLHIWVQTIWAAVADKFGRILIPDPDKIPNDIFSGIPAKVASRFTEPQRAALNRYFSGMSRAELDAKLEDRLEYLVEYLRNDHGSRTGNVANFDAYSEQEQTIRSELAQSIRRIGDRIYEAKGRDTFMTWAAEMAGQSAEVEKAQARLFEDGGQNSAGVAIDKKVSAWATRLQELHADLLGLINTYEYLDGDLEKAIRACAAADAHLAGGRYASVDAMIKKADALADLLRISPEDETLFHDQVYGGRESHPRPVVRIAMYRLFSKTPAFKIVTNRLYRSLWAYTELVRALQLESHGQQDSSEAAFQAEWAAGRARIQKILDAYEAPLFESLMADADALAQKKIKPEDSLFKKVFDFWELYNNARDAESTKVWGRWDWNVAQLLGGRESFLARVREGLNAKLTKLMGPGIATSPEAMAYFTIDQMLAASGVSRPRVGLGDVFVNQLKNPGNPGDGGGDGGFGPGIPLAENLKNWNDHFAEKASPNKPAGSAKASESSLRCGHILAPMTSKE